LASTYPRNSRKNQKFAAPGYEEEQDGGAGVWLWDMKVAKEMETPANANSDKHLR
jgi:hypothetical protein